ncbi:heavy-metal-associated domain-containing protein [Mycolicibacterium peregrinum]|uniref:heavy-metal-associated domain-containing protein n=1 Tax=Mycolicibacterium peregrinum TaxID=43304 RepID=UPI003AAA5846
MAVTDVAAHRTEAPGTRRIRLDVTGMSCGACSRRVENALNTIDGVQASVAISTKIATIDAAPDVSVADLCDAVEQAGYHAIERTVTDATESAPEEPSPKRSLVSRAVRWVTVGHMGG